MIGIHIIDPSKPENLEALNKATQAWTLKAARGECSWVCSDCCSTFPSGMPDACDHGDERCTEIIQRDKKEAHSQTGGQHD